MQQEDGKSYSSIHTIRGVLRPAFQMAVDDDILVKNPFGFQLAGVLVNDAVTREAISKDQMRKFLKFVHDDVVYCKYYEVMYILFHTGMRISEFCGLTLKDIDLENRTVNIDHQLQRTSDMRYIIETTKTDAGTRVLPITEDVAQMFQTIIEDRNAPKVEKSIDGYSGFLFYDDNGMPLVAMHWQHRFNHMVGRYNDIYRVQMPNITPHVCRHTYCSNMEKSGMNPKTLQYLMGHSDISVTMNVYTHIGFDDAEEELKRMEEFRKAQAEVEQKKEKPMSQKMFRELEKQIGYDLDSQMHPEGRSMTVEELVERYLSTRIGVKPNTKANYNFVKNLMKKEDFYYKKIGDVKTSDAKRYNDIYRMQMPNITPHVCRHTYCSNMAKSGMNPKTLQYLMGHSDIGVTLNTYTHLGLEDAEDELKRLEDLQNARKELERTQGEKPVSQKMFKAI